MVITYYGFIFPFSIFGQDSQHSQFPYSFSVLEKCLRWVWEVFFLQRLIFSFVLQRIPGCCHSYPFCTVLAVIRLKILAWLTARSLSVWSWWCFIFLPVFLFIDVVVHVLLCIQGRGVRYIRATYRYLWLNSPNFITGHTWWLGHGIGTKPGALLWLMELNSPHALRTVDTFDSNIHNLNILLTHYYRTIIIYQSKQRERYCFLN